MKYRYHVDRIGMVCQKLDIHMVEVLRLELRRGMV